jgi:hypothetical protein
LNKNAKFIGEIFREKKGENIIDKKNCRRKEERDKEFLLIF